MVPRAGKLRQPREGQCPEWEADAATCREGVWWGAKGTQVMLRFEVPLLIVPALIPELTPFP